MLLALIFLTLLTKIPHSYTIIISCVPNSHFILNGHLCYCNNVGQSDEASCQLIGRRQACYPGQIIWEECRQCICQENGNLLCTNTECAEEIKHKHHLRNDSEIWCTPFRSYYINCTLCVCPASGKISEGKCAEDSLCVLKGHHTSYDTISQHKCIPKVMYLFNCFQCLCSDNGLFLSSQCTDTCHTLTDSSKRCIPRSFYKTDCNICYCPETGIPDSNACTKIECANNFKLINLNSIRNTMFSCTPNKFTKPRCMYCECNSQGRVNEQACMEQECLKIGDYKYDSIRATCTSGEMVPSCMECFCPRSKLTAEKYCSKVCSNQNKIAILENVLKEKIHLIDLTILKETSGTDTCDTNALFLDQGRYCLCSEEENTNIKYCTSVVEYNVPTKRSTYFVKSNANKQREIDYNGSCEPNTYVGFGCNFCYCAKNGKIDQKWCTNDNCKAKNFIYDSLKGPAASLPQKSPDVKCVPGTVTNNDCNFCICGSSGLLAESACTKDDCTTISTTNSNEFNCEPASYYTVDCNVCLCSSDGVKNVDNCTKNQCENNFLRSEICSPGELFSDDCNICICPPNGDKKYKICTKRTCSANDTPWKNIFKLSQSLLKLRDETPVSSQNFQPCFPGEEFEVGCKICVCPEMGLKAYATCAESLCDEQNHTMAPIHKESEEAGTDLFKEDRIYNSNELPIYEIDRRRKTYINANADFCKVYNITESREMSECTPGSEYIIKCRICICPYMGSIYNFCRPMPPDRYCEMAYPGYNFEPMGRRHEENVNQKNNSTASAVMKKYPIQIHMPHNHTRYKCDNPGRLKDECYICDCQENVIIEEHCFKSDAENCIYITKPSFIKLENKLHEF